MTKFLLFLLCAFLIVWGVESGRCPEWMSYYDDSCYDYNTEKKTFAAAQAACKSLGGNLVEISGAGENDFLIGMKNSLHPGNRDAAWIGLNDLDTEDTFKWISTGLETTYTKWNSGEPNNDEGDEGEWDGEDCIELRYNGYWNDIQCHYLQPYFCERSTTGSCPEGASYFGGSCYTYNTASRNFDTAKTNCNDQGGHLVEVNNAAENNFLLEIKKNKYPNNDASAWIGLNDKDTEGVYKWISSSTETAFTNWNSGEPNNVSGEVNDFAGEDCIEIANNGKWNDQGCYFWRNYFCESAAV